MSGNNKHVGQIVLTFKQLSASTVEWLAASVFHAAPVGVPGSIPGLVEDLFGLEIFSTGTGARSS